MKACFDSAKWGRANIPSNLNAVSYISLMPGERIAVLLARCGQHYGAGVDQMDAMKAHVPPVTIGRVFTKRDSGSNSPDGCIPGFAMFLFPEMYPDISPSGAHVAGPILGRVCTKWRHGRQVDRRPVVAPSLAPTSLDKAGDVVVYERILIGASINQTDGVLAQDVSGLVAGAVPDRVQQLPVEGVFLLETGQVQPSLIIAANLQVAKSRVIQGVESCRFIVDDVLELA